jgi:hypothetical protein
LVPLFKFLEVLDLLVVNEIQLRRLGLQQLAQRALQNAEGLLELVLP